MRRVSIGIVLALALPSAAQAKYIPPQDEAPPGVTIAGLGFARADREGMATHRAIRDARRRATAIARAAGLRLGDATRVELQDTFQQFGTRPGPFTAKVATVTHAIVAGGRGAEAGPEVSGYGDAQVRLRYRSPRSSRSIRRTLLSARAAVTSRAATDAVQNARRAAGAAGLALGPIVSISQPSEGYFYDAALGGFAPGLFCKAIRRRGETRRRCFRPSSYALRLEATFEAR